MEFSKLIKERRLQLKYGVRELSRETAKPWVPFPIKSAIYISRLENKVVEEMRAEAVSIDKLWALGVALQMNPLILLASSRSMPELIDQIPMFSMRECDPADFSAFLRGRRHALDMSMREVEDRSAKCSHWSISGGYLCQLEDSGSDHASTVSAEKLWTLGRVYDVDPLLMYVLSRKIDPRYLKAASRDRLFS